MGSQALLLRALVGLSELRIGFKNLNWTSHLDWLQTVQVSICSTGEGTWFFPNAYRIWKPNLINLR
jgi:hypothetical protein